MIHNQACREIRVNQACNEIKHHIINISRYYISQITISRIFFIYKISNNICQHICLNVYT